MSGPAEESAWRGSSWRGDEAQSGIPLRPLRLRSPYFEHVFALSTVGGCCADAVPRRAWQRVWRAAGSGPTSRHSGGRSCGERESHTDRCADSDRHAHPTTNRLHNAGGASDAHRPECGLRARSDAASGLRGARGWPGPRLPAPRFRALGRPRIAQPAIEHRPPSCRSPWEWGRAPSCPPLPQVLSDVVPRIGWPRTSVPDVDSILAALESRDQAALAGVHGGISVGCDELRRVRMERQPTIFGTHVLPCAEGAQVASISLVNSCSHAGYAAAAAGSAETVRYLTQPHWLYAIYRATPSSGLEVLAGYFGAASRSDWIVVLGAQPPLSLQFLVRQGKIVGRSTCSSWSGPGSFVRPSYESVEFLVPPP